MNELSLFSGAGGGLLAAKYMLGWRTVGYIEWERYPQKVIAQRIKDGLLDKAPIFGDIRTFISEGYAAQYKGLVDVITAGFPCQPFSKSGKMLSKQDSRNMWPATCQTIKIVKPSYIFLENVSGIISCGYIGDVLKNLSEAGYNAKWLTLGGAETGSVCNGERLWLLAVKADCPMQESMDFQKHIIPYSKESCRRQYSGAISAMLLQDDYSNIKRNPDEVARGMDRLKAIGNGQDPIVAATAWNILTNGNSLKEEPINMR